MSERNYDQELVFEDSSSFVINLLYIAQRWMKLMKCISSAL